jgi:hypothetical protein
LGFSSIQIYSTSYNTYFITVINLKYITRTYIKASKENINKIAILFRVDPQKIELFSILNKQVELLAKKGQPDPSCLFNSLESHSIILSEEVSSL